MLVRRGLISLAAVLLAAGCSDERPTGVPPAPVPQALRWAGSAAPRFIAPQPASTRPTKGGLKPLLAGGLSLDHNTVTFWAVRGKERSVQINYLSSTGQTSFPFLNLSISDPNYVPGRGWLRWGDSVLITVTVDPSNIAVSLEPSGLRFGDAARLQIWYGGAGGDLNGDGAVDQTDTAIDSQLLGLWYREGSGSAWTRIPASQSLGDRSFISALRHFCDYEVSFAESAVSW